MSKKLVIASTNSHKVERLTWVAAPHFDKIVVQSQKIDVKETGRTFEESAIIRAEHISKYYGVYAIASDGGVVVPAEGDTRNEALARRLLGHATVTDKNKGNDSLEVRRLREEEDRAVIWRESIALAWNGRLLFSSEVEGDRAVVSTAYDPTRYQIGVWQRLKDELDWFITS